MAPVENKPQLQDCLNALWALPPAILGRLDPQEDGSYPLITRLLAESIAWVEDQATTSFDARWLPAYNADYSDATDYDFVQTPPGTEYATLGDGTKVGYEYYDGNGTNQIVLRKKPAIEVAEVRVVTPILGYTRVYTRDEIQLYVRQGVLKVFTYKLAVEQALLQTVDYQAWGSLFPPLPRAVQAAYCYGFPTFDPTFTGVDGITGAPITGAPATSFDAGHSWRTGDQRDGELNNWLTNLQEAAVANACAQVLGQSLGLIRGVAESVSFDGYSRSLSGQPFAQEVANFEKRRDEIMGRRGRRFTMSTVG